MFLHTYGTFYGIDPYHILLSLEYWLKMGEITNSLIFAGIMVNILCRLTLSFQEVSLQPLVPCLKMALWDPWDHKCPNWGLKVCINWLTIKRGSSSHIQPQIGISRGHMGHYQSSTHQNLTFYKFFKFLRMKVKGAITLKPPVIFHITQEWY